MAGRTIAIGDIHGCLAALVALIDAGGPDRGDTVPRSATISTAARTAARCWIV
jgi:hypothetical protein